ncbi:hypothetical protein RO3G_12581 [Rhizopus delemar RA 99-880]|uniref:Uncharacterized protein n=1 Tax=Rhizopus delemar (strain RA 99-880 / ATCC MYA-4621 / FGSC 9543 / NRRL 43880) TaxID=246409 RepID=I1CHE0_RHIO9|nr:hypothetical protein RO3G_12581 [Rhizopus delemar RA 99-880]|eukprot:EIE87870.1 hypothetical protein RO3G_12581 [Rhizopus delemar RA 99-880]
MFCCSVDYCQLIEHDKYHICVTTNASLQASFASSDSQVSVQEDSCSYQTGYGFY